VVIVKLNIKKTDYFYGFNYSFNFPFLNFKNWRGLTN